MRNLFLLTLILSLTSSVFATDLVVENGGINPAYGSIADAVAAASNGDRIIIKNRPGNIPWIEDVTIDKSLEFLSFDNDTFFVVQGNYTILGFAGMKVNIIGMQNLVGNITSSGNVSNGDATVMIMDSKLEQGYMSFTFNNYHLTVAGCELMDGYINLEQGGIYGCEISDNYNGGLIRVYASSSTLSDKSIDIVGNILTQSNTSSSAAGIYWSSQQAYFNISNNFINTNERGIYVTAAIDADSLINQMYNNTIFLNTSSTYGIFLTYATTNNLPILECMNNVIDSRFNTSSDYGLYISGFDGTLNVYYNHFDSALNSKI
ncbi:MAG: hypothetical protein MRY83_23955, partial [Flavobacteriales bacterium]|nr:hypothetical protein [Flavobacteriales bacterium]